MQKTNRLMSFLLLLAITGVAHATVITFSENPVGTVVTNQYAAFGVTFTGALGSAPIIANDSAMPGSPVLAPNPPYAGTFDIIFPSGAVGVSFDSGYWDSVGSGVIDIYNTSNVLVGFMSDTTVGVDHMDLSAFGIIGKIYFDSTADSGGADIDNLGFTDAPEPGTLLLLGGGLILMVPLRRVIGRR